MAICWSEGKAAKWSARSRARSFCITCRLGAVKSAGICSSRRAETVFRLQSWIPRLEAESSHHKHNECSDQEIHSIQLAYEQQIPRSIRTVQQRWISIYIRRNDQTVQRSRPAQREHK